MCQLYEPKMAMNMALMSVPEGFNIQHDPNNPYNKIIYSRVNEFERCRASRGLSLKYVYEGNESYFLSGKRHEVRSGEFLLVNHQQEVATAVLSKRPVEGVCFYFDPAMVSDLNRNNHLSHNELLDTPFHNESITEISERVLTLRHSRVMPYVRSYYQQMSEDSPLEQYLFHEMLEAIFVFGDEVKKRQSNIKAARKSTREELYSRMLIARSFIMDNLDRKISIQDLARVTLMSEFHFLRTFRQAFGQTPNQYIIGRRLQEAQKLLGTTSLSITSIAIECGFSDVQYFSRTFKKHYKCAPSDMRNT